MKNNYFSLIYLYCIEHIHHKYIIFHFHYNNLICEGFRFSLFYPSIYFHLNFNTIYPNYYKNPSRYKVSFSYQYQNLFLTQIYSSLSNIIYIPHMYSIFHFHYNNLLNL